MVKKRVCDCFFSLRALGWRLGLQSMQGVFILFLFLRALGWRLGLQSMQGVFIMFLFLRALGWRLGLQSMQGVFILAFFLGLFYRSATLYHPQGSTDTERSLTQQQPQSPQCPKKELTLHIITEPVTVGADATVYVWFLC